MEDKPKSLFTKLISSEDPEQTHNFMAILACLGLILLALGLGAACVWTTKNLMAELTGVVTNLVGLVGYTVKKAIEKVGS